MSALGGYPASRFISDAQGFCCLDVRSAKTPSVHLESEAVSILDWNHRPACTGISVQLAPERAIRAFESLNDRGKPLSLMDKTKSFLMYSARNLSKDVNDHIRDCFSSAFLSYDDIKEAGKGNIDYITRDKFTEDELLRLFYHYFARHSIDKYSLKSVNYNFRISTEGVFESFIKRTISEIKSDTPKLEAFLEDLLLSFDRFIESFRTLAMKAQQPSVEMKLLRFMGLNAYTYPLLISLKTENMFKGKLVKAVETLDFRVYQVHNTDRVAELYKDTLSRIRDEKKATELRNRISSFIGIDRKDARMASYLSEDMYGSPIVKYILWEFEKGMARRESYEFDEWDIELYETLEIEHVFAETSILAYPACDFADETDYLRSIHKLGNLFLLEKGINRRIGNELPEQKAKFYRESKVPGIKRLGFMLQTETIGKQYIESRTKELVRFCLSRWRL